MRTTHAHINTHASKLQLLFTYVWGFTLLVYVIIMYIAIAHNAYELILFLRCAQRRIEPRDQECACTLVSYVCVSVCGVVRARVWYTDHTRRLCCEMIRSADRFTLHNSSSRVRQACVQPVFESWIAQIGNAIITQIELSCFE